MKIEVKKKQKTRKKNCAKSILAKKTDITKLVAVEVAASEGGTGSGKDERRTEFLTPQCAWMRPPML